MARNFNRKSYFAKKKQRDRQIANKVTPATAERDGKTVTITRGTSHLPDWKKNGEALHCSEALAEKLEIGDTILLDGHTLQVNGKGDSFKEAGYLQRYVYVTGGPVQELEIHTCLECGFETTNPRLIDAGGMGCVRCNH